MSKSCPVFKNSHLKVVLAYFLCLALPLSVFAGIVVYSSYAMDAARSRALLKSEEKYLTILRANTIADLLNSAIDDIVFLSKNHEIVRAFDVDSSRGDITSDLAAFCEKKPFCYKARILDRDGMEVVKVERGGAGLVVSSEEALQQKAHRYYFRETFRLERGEVYVSPMDLDVEYGEIETPWEPVIRIGTPLFDRRGRKSGILIVSLLGDRLLAKIKVVSPRSRGRMMIVNPDGYWLYGARPGDEYGFMFEDRVDRVLGKTYPGLWRKVSTAEAGQVYGGAEDPGYSGLDVNTYSPGSDFFTFVTLYRTASGFVRSGWPDEAGFEGGGAAAGTPYWKIISSVPSNVIVGVTPGKYLILYASLVGAIMAFSGVLANNRGRRARAEERIKAQETRYRMLHDSAFDGIVITDKAGTIVECNKSMEDIFGYGPGELAGGNILSLMPEQYREKHLKGLHRFIHTGESRAQGSVLQLEGLSKDGEVFPIELTINHFRVDSEMYLTGTIRDISQRKRSEETIKKMAYYDQLTGLPNRTLLLDRLNQAILRGQRSGLVVGVLFLDLDSFKEINDTLGHAAGDRLLTAVADRLVKGFRATDAVSRLGGDEFVILVPDASSEEGVATAAEKARALFSEPFDVDGHELFVTTSIGVSIFPHDGGEVETLMKNADVAMYKAKEDGGNGYYLYDPSMNARAAKKLKLQNKLRTALDRGEFFLVYHPQIAVRNGEVVGMEALLRWRDPEEGLIPPAEFIPMAEANRLIVPIGEWVLRTACADGRRLQEMGLEGLITTVNVSVVQLKQKGFPAVVLKILGETGLDPHHLELEISESILMENADDTIGMLKELKSIGVRLSMDDFGTGYSSLAYLKRMPLDALKLDRSFISDITAADSFQIIRTIIEMAHNFDNEVIAEGVETPKQLNHLKLLGCDKVQGFLFTEPIGPEEVLAFCEMQGKKRRSA